MSYETRNEQQRSAEQTPEMGHPLESEGLKSSDDIRKPDSRIVNLQASERTEVVCHKERRQASYRENLARQQRSRKVVVPSPDVLDSKAIADGLRRKARQDKQFQAREKKRCKVLKIPYVKPEVMKPAHIKTPAQIERDEKRLSRLKSVRKEPQVSEYIDKAVVVAPKKKKYTEKDAKADELTLVGDLFGVDVPKVETDLTAVIVAAMAAGLIGCPKKRKPNVPTEVTQYVGWIRVPAFHMQQLKIAELAQASKDYLKELHKSVKEMQPRSAELFSLVTRECRKAGVIERVRAKKKEVVRVGEAKNPGPTAEEIKRLTELMYGVSTLDVGSFRYTSGRSVKRHTKNCSYASMGVRKAEVAALMEKGWVRDLTKDGHVEKNPGPVLQYLPIVSYVVVFSAIMCASGILDNLFSDHELQAVVAVVLIVNLAEVRRQLLLMAGDVERNPGPAKKSVPQWYKKVDKPSLNANDLLVFTIFSEEPPTLICDHGKCGTKVVLAMKEELNLKGLCRAAKAAQKKKLKIILGQPDLDRLQSNFAKNQFKDLPLVEVTVCSTLEQAISVYQRMVHRGKDEPEDDECFVNVEAINFEEDEVDCFRTVYEVPAVQTPKPAQPSSSATMSSTPNNTPPLPIPTVAPVVTTPPIPILDPIQLEQAKALIEGQHSVGAYAIIAEQKAAHKAIRRAAWFEQPLKSAKAQEITEQWFEFAKIVEETQATERAELYKEYLQVCFPDKIRSDDMKTMFSDSQDLQKHLDKTKGFFATEEIIRKWTEQAWERELQEILDTPTEFGQRSIYFVYEPHSILGKYKLGITMQPENLTFLTAIEWYKEQLKANSFDCMGQSVDYYIENASEPALMEMIQMVDPMGHRIIDRLSFSGILTFLAGYPMTLGFDLAMLITTYGLHNLYKYHYVFPVVVYNYSKPMSPTHAINYDIIHHIPQGLAHNDLVFDETYNKVIVSPNLANCQGTVAFTTEETVLRVEYVNTGRYLVQRLSEEPRHAESRGLFLRSWLRVKASAKWGLCRRIKFWYKRWKVPKHMDSKELSKSLGEMKQPGDRNIEGVSGVIDQKAYDAALSNMICLLKPANDAVTIKANTLVVLNQQHTMTKVYGVSPVQAANLTPQIADRAVAIQTSLGTVSRRVSEHPTMFC